MAVVSIDNTLGAVFIGGWVTAISFGITCVQAIFFLRHEANKDKTKLKWAVAALWAADTLHSIFVAKTLYWYLVQSFGNREALYSYPWSLMASLCMDNVSDTVVRIFFTYRVWILSQRNWFVTGTLGLLVIAVPVTGIVGAGYGFTYSNFMDFAPIGWLMMLTFTGAVAADILIAMALVFYLLRSRSKPTGFSSALFKRTDTIINGIIIYVINTGILTCLASLFCLIFFVTYLHTFIFLAFHFPISPIYVNALLGSFNARPSIGSRPVEITYDSKGSLPLYASKRATTRAMASISHGLKDGPRDIAKASMHSSDSDTLCARGSLEGPMKRDSSIAFGISTVSPI